MNALNALFLEIEKHAIYRAHVTLVMEARKEAEDVLQRAKELARLYRIAKAAELLADRLRANKKYQKEQVDGESLITGEDLFNDFDEEALTKYELAVSK